jgi:protein phosphatase
MTISLPALSLVVLIGPSGSGKSTFARRHFLETEILSSDRFRGLVSDDENDQSATADAFDLLHATLRKRLERGRLTVVDATNVQKESRQSLVALAREYHVLPAAIVLNIDESVCHKRNRMRDDRQFGPHVIRQQVSQLRRHMRTLQREGFRHVTILRSPEDVDAVSVTRVPLWTDRRGELGPFDIIGDVHGCCDELETLLQRLGYVRVPIAEPRPLWGDVTYEHPLGRRAVFLGDLVDRGPRVLDTVRLVRSMMDHGTAFCLPGNHEAKLLRYLRGARVQLRHGLAETVAELEALPQEHQSKFRQELADFLDSLVSHFVLDEGRLVVAHAGMKESMQGRASGAVRSFALYGETTGETDEFGLPKRYAWAADYRGLAQVVYGHTPVPDPLELNGTVNIDTGCVFGGRLTALRYPEREYVSVPAARVYCEPIRPLVAEAIEARSQQHEHDDLLDADDVRGKRIIETRLHPAVTIRAENATAALEVMSRFAADPKWLVYLPPTMSPCESSPLENYLEHPAEAFRYFRAQGVPQVICQEKHMGSRAVAVVCRDVDVAKRRFGIVTDESGIVYTRTGRRFFSDATLEAQLVDRIRLAMSESGLWESLETDWICLDCELMPWSAKAQELIRSQYASVGAAGRAALPSTMAALQLAHTRLSEEEAQQAAEVLSRFQEKKSAIELFTQAYRQYCWPVESIDDWRLAPFHILASEGHVHADRPHAWHMDTIAQLCRAGGPLLQETNHRFVDVTDEDSERAATDWWTNLVASGGEGMVVKPADFIARGTRGLVQPAIKCRGPEYLRIIYGPDYTMPDNLSRLRQRGVGRKRSLALREFALGLEALSRFVERQPLRRVHECVFGVLALESEPVDPRL